MEFSYLGVYYVPILIHCCQYICILLICFLIILISHILKSFFKTLFTNKLNFNLRKKLIKCYTWSIALYGVET
jgi:hypothetical protein